MKKKIVTGIMALLLLSGASSAFATVRSSDLKDFTVSGTSTMARGIVEIYDSPGSTPNNVVAAGSTALSGNSTYKLQVTVVGYIQGNLVGTSTNSGTGTATTTSVNLGAVSGSVVYSTNASHSVYLSGTLKGSTNTSCYW